MERLQDKPFALIGINSDKDIDYYRSEAKDMEVTWRSFWCGEDGTSGAIPAKWAVTGWPTIYVLDHKGVIRFTNVRGEKMDAAVDTLLAEIEQDR
ncbi:MAG: hypothetical protein KDC98_15420 [Planctomycetes bacterium]|nr:hypothetical protein [Planctomycetota bacterium]